MDVEMGGRGRRPNSKDEHDSPARKRYPTMALGEAVARLGACLGRTESPHRGLLAYAYSRLDW